MKKEKKEKPNKKEKKEKNLTQIKNWYQDRYETVLIQRNLLFIFITVLSLIFGLVIIGVVQLNSSKVFEPFVVQIEEATGIITKVNNQEVRTLPAEKAVRNSSLVRYVLSRESYNFADYHYNYYQIVRLMSDRNVYSEFSSKINADNPDSPLALGFDSKVETKIKTIIDLDEKRNLVQIRVSKARIPTRTTDSASVAFAKNEKSYIITLTYEYKSLNLSETERYINPLGIQITAYNITEEVNAKAI